MNGFWGWVMKFSGKALGVLSRTNDRRIKDKSI